MELNQMAFLNPLERLSVNSKTTGGFSLTLYFINASSVPFYLTFEMVLDSDLNIILVETYFSNFSQVLYLVMKCLILNSKLT